MLFPPELPRGMALAAAARLGTTFPQGSAGRNAAWRLIWRGQLANGGRQVQLRGVRPLTAGPRGRGCRDGPDSRPRAAFTSI